MIFYDKIYIQVCQPILCTQMIVRGHFSETDLVWIDGLIPNKASLDRLVLPKSLFNYRLKPNSTLDLIGQNILENLPENDRCYSSLLASHLSSSLDALEIESRDLEVLYIIPVGLKPSYSDILESLRNGKYTPHDYQLLRYGPERVLFGRRKYRYRQIIGISKNHEANECLLETINKSNFTVLYHYYNRHSWGVNLFNLEVQDFLRKISAIKNAINNNNYLENLIDQKIFVHRIPSRR